MTGSAYFKTLQKLWFGYFLEKLSQAIGNLSCLDRMMDPGARGVPESAHHHSPAEEAEPEQAAV